MTTPAAPTEAPNLTLIRERRDRSGTYRLYVDDILIGRLDQIRTRNTTERYSARGRLCSRWRGTATTVAFTLNRIGAARPDPALLAPLPAEHRDRADAARALIEHLRAAGAAGVASLYGATS